MQQTTDAHGITHVRTDVLEARGLKRLLTRFVTRIRQAHLGLVAGALILTIVLLMAFLAPVIATHDPYAQDLGQRLIPPVWYEKGRWSHVLGTDQFGRDYFSRLVYGARISLTIGVTTVLISGAIGITMGALAGFFGGRTDAIISFLINVRLAIPVILVALAVAALAGNSLETIILALGFLLWDRFAVVARATVMALRNQEYIHAARTVGSSNLRIILTEILPNAMNPIMVVATLEMAHAILLESALSFLGLGVSPPIPSWGLMIAEGKSLMFFSPWVIAIPGTALFLLVMGINLLGDGIRDMSEGRERRN